MTEYNSTATRPATPPPPAVRVKLPFPRPQARHGAPVRTAASLRPADLVLTPGAARLHDLVVSLAHDVVTHRGHQVAPSTIVFHLPATLAAFVLGYTDRHLRRLVLELEAAELIDHGAHACRVGAVNLWGGSLWAVRLTPGGPPPRLRRENYRHVWRQFADDLRNGATAQRIMSSLRDQQADSETKYRAARRWATVGATVPTPPVGSTEDTAAREVVYQLPALLDLHPRARQATVSTMAATLAATLNDPNSRKLYAYLLNRAVDAEHRGIRALSMLGNALQRLLIDVAEWSELKKPGALLVARLKHDGVWAQLQV